MSGAANARREIGALTGIRGLAAWAVVLYHIRLSLTGLLPSPIIAVLAKGYLAVDLFFVLSGFVIWLNYAATIGAGGPGEIARFWWRRFARIWPLHATILVAFLALALLLLASGRAAPDYPLAELPLHLLLVQDWGFTNALAWNHPAWSISAEAAAYLVFPAFALASARTPRLASAAALGLAAGLCLLLWGRFAVAGQASLGADISQLGLWRCLCGFALGCVACVLWQRQTGTASGWFGCAFGWAAGGLALDWPETAIVPFAVFAAILALASDRSVLSRWIGQGAVLRLGEISYSTYLAHALLFTLFKFVFVGDDLQLGWLELVGYLALVFVASVLLYRLVERPAQRRLNRLVRASPAQPSAA